MNAIFQKSEIIRGVKEIQKCEKLQVVRLERIENLEETSHDQNHDVTWKNVFCHEFLEIVEEYWIFHSM